MCTGLPLWETVTFEIPQVSWYKVSYHLPIPRANSMKRLFLFTMQLNCGNCGIMLFLTVFPFFNYLQRCSEIQELSQNTFLWQSVLPIDGCCEDLEVSSVKWLKDHFARSGSHQSKYKICFILHARGFSHRVKICTIAPLRWVGGFSSSFSTEWKSGDCWLVWKTEFLVHNQTGIL